MISVSRGGGEICDILIRGQRFVIVCDRGGRRSKKLKFSVTYFTDDPLLVLELPILIFLQLSFLMSMKLRQKTLHSGHICHYFCVEGFCFGLFVN